MSEIYANTKNTNKHKYYLPPRNKFLLCPRRKKNNIFVTKTPNEFICLETIAQIITTESYFAKKSSQSKCQYVSLSQFNVKLFFYFLFYGLVTETLSQILIMFNCSWLSDKTASDFRALEYVVTISSGRAVIQ